MTTIPRRAAGRGALLLLALLAVLPPQTCRAEEPSLTSETVAPNTRLMRAIWRRQPDAVADALEAGASPNYIAPFAEFKTEFSGTGWAERPERLISALSLAAQLADLTLMQTLIDDGADINLHARADQSNLPASKSGLEMARLLILKGYRPTAQDIISALSLRATPGWEDWAAAVLTAPGVPQRLSAIRAGTDPDYQRLMAQQADEQNQASHENEAFERQMQTAQQQEQTSRDGSLVIGAIDIGDMVCSKPGVYHTKYVAYIESRNEDRVLLKILGGFNRKATEFHANEMHWDDMAKWTPCTYRVD